MSRNTIEINSSMIDLIVEVLSKLIIRLEKNPKKTRKYQNMIKKNQEILHTGFGPIDEVEKEFTFL